jgi:hypothetical protein
MTSGRRRCPPAGRSRSTDRCWTTTTRTPPARCTRRQSRAGGASAASAAAASTISARCSRAGHGGGTCAAMRSGGAGARRGCARLTRAGNRHTAPVVLRIRPMLALIAAGGRRFAASTCGSRQGPAPSCYIQAEGRGRPTLRRGVPRQGHDFALKNDGGSVARTRD